MFLPLPAHRIADFGMLQFAEYVLDHSPTYGSRSLMRNGIKAVDAIAAAITAGAEWAEMPQDVAELFQRACAEVAIPRLFLRLRDGAGNLLGEPEPIGARAFSPFYEAAENMVASIPAAAAE